MLPLRDDNPTRRFPLVTVVLIVLNVGAFLFFQPQGGGLVGSPDAPTDPRRAQLEEIEFNFEHAAIPCEITEGRPLTAEEIQRTVVGGDATACTDTAAGRPLFADKRVWLAVLVSMFLHANLLHLGGNMLFLWIFGNNIEDSMGRVRFVVFYVLGGVVALLAQTGIDPDSTTPTIGASGAVAAVLGGYALLYPRARVVTVVFIILIFTVLELPALVVLGLWFLLQLFYAGAELAQPVAGGGGVAYFAHIGGFLFGLLLIKLFANRAHKDYDDRGRLPVY